MIQVVADKSIVKLPELFAHPPFKFNQATILDTEAVRGAQILVCRSTSIINEKLLDGSNIECVASVTSGLDHIDLDYLSRRNIPCLHALGANAQSVSEYVLSVIANLKNLNGNKVGIIGVGEVGSRLAKQLTQLGFEVLLNDPVRAANERGFNHSPLKAIQQCDVISLHTPLSYQSPHPTHHLVNADFLAKLKPNTALINTARGGIVDELAIIKHRFPLRYCFDVFEYEPKPRKDIIELCEIATPHIAGHAIEAKLRASLIVYRQLCALYRVEPIGTPGDSLLLDASNEFPLEAYLADSPLAETKALKKMGAHSDFSSIRAQHCFRHELSMSSRPRCMPFGDALYSSPTI